jgi:hypothetical protein
MQLVYPGRYRAQMTGEKREGACHRWAREGSIGMTGLCRKNRVAGGPARVVVATDDLRVAVHGVG